MDTHATGQGTNNFKEKKGMPADRRTGARLRGLTTADGNTPAGPTGRDNGSRPFPKSFMFRMRARRKKSNNSTNKTHKKI